MISRIFMFIAITFIIFCLVFAFTEKHKPVFKENKIYQNLVFGAKEHKKVKQPYVEYIVYDKKEDKIFYLNKKKFFKYYSNECQKISVDYFDNLIVADLKYFEINTNRKYETHEVKCIDYK